MAQSCFPGSMPFAVVTSWVGGYAGDELTLDMLEKYGYRATFFVNPDRVGKAGRLSADAVKRIDAAQEIGLLFEGNPDAESLRAKRVELEAITGKPVISLAVSGEASPVEAATAVDVPTVHVSTFMTDSLTVAAALAAGFRALSGGEATEAVTAGALGGPLCVVPATLHHTAQFMEVQEKWMAVEETECGVLHLTGHSDGVTDNPNDWVDLECTMGYLGGMSDTWYGTLAEVAEAAAAIAAGR